MGKRNDGEHGNVGDRQGETTGGGAAALQRTPSQEENVPPLALLSPNVGVSYYAHAAAAAADNGECKAPEAADDSAMDVDTTSAAPTKNVLEWMRDDAPPELLPKLLSFCGSRKMNALSRVNKAWNGVMKDESVWRVVCEDTHKVCFACLSPTPLLHPGPCDLTLSLLPSLHSITLLQWKDGDEIPTSWAHLYKSSPCVPIDYDTIDAAFESISSGNRIRTRENHVVHTYREQRQSARILLHPGPYFLPRPIVANVVGTAEVAIELIQGVIDPQHGMTWRQNYHKPSSSSSSEEEMETSETDRELLLPGAYFNASTPRPSSPTLRQMFGCGRRSSSSAAAAEAFANSESSEHSNNEDCQSEHRAEFHRSCFDGPRPTALLCLESRNESEPIIRVRQGIVNLRGLKFVHYCEGTDIWNGNAAVQVQRAFGRNGRPLRVEPPSIIPTANLSDCDIMSLSGRGIVIIDGSTSHIHNCNVHTSAATGVYVGGAGSKALLTQTDVVDNGTGNTRNTSRNRGVARGHSGVYVEQGLAKMHDCNISGNTLTGISAVSTVQARLHIEESDIRANRSDQMELPSPESGRSVNRNNTIAQDGPGRPRSQHLRETVVVETPRQRSEPPTPQSPVEDTLLGA